MSAIAQELEPVRPEQSTLDYGDRISNAPGAKTPSKFPAPRPSARPTPRPARKAERSAPEITISQTSIGRDTLALIAEQLIASPDSAAVAEKPKPSFVRDQAPTIDDGVYNAPLAIFEMLTFVVQGPEVAQLASEALRRRFVEEHLLHRLPAKDMAQVDRIDVTPWTVHGTVVVRVWCRV